MNKRLEEIKLRQRLLVTRAAAQRHEIAQVAAGWRRPLRYVDEMIATVRTIRMHPAVALMGQQLLMTAAPKYRLLVLWAGRGLIGWGVYRTVRELWPIYRSGKDKTPEPEREAERVD